MGWAFPKESITGRQALSHQKRKKKEANTAQSTCNTD